MRVKIPGGKVKELVIVENRLVFGEDGFAPADHLTAEEIDRCRRLGFHFEADASTPVQEISSETTLPGTPPDEDIPAKTEDELPPKLPKKGPGGKFLPKKESGE